MIKNNLSIVKHTTYIILYRNGENTHQCRLAHKCYLLNSNSYLESMSNSWFKELQCMIYTRLRKLCTNWLCNLKNFPSDIVYDTNFWKSITLHHKKYTAYKILQYNLSKQNDNSRNFRCFCFQIYEKDMIEHTLYSEDMWKPCMYRSYQCWVRDMLDIARNMVCIFITIRFGKIRLDNWEHILCSRDTILNMLK